MIEVVVVGWRLEGRNNIQLWLPAVQTRLACRDGSGGKREVRNKQFKHRFQSFSTFSCLIPFSSRLVKAAAEMANSTSDLHNKIILLSEPIRESLSTISNEQSDVSVRSLLQSLLPPTNQTDFQSLLTNFSLLCAALAASRTSTYDQLSWIPVTLSDSADSALRQLHKAFSDHRNKDLLVELMPGVLPLLKSSIKESSIDKDADGDEASGASTRVPVVYAIVAAYQFKWFVTQIDLQLLGNLCSLIIPCALTALDHWSPEVKGQGMITLIHLAKHVSCSEFSMYEDVILDACCQNIASDDGIWEHVVEMSVLLVTCTQQNNPRSSWFEKVLNEMLSHLWRQPRSKERRVAWLKHIEPLFTGMGIVLLGHFRRLFPLFFKWMHADDDETVLLARTGDDNSFCHCSKFYICFENAKASSLEQHGQNTKMIQIYQHFVTHWLAAAADFQLALVSIGLYLQLFVINFTTP
ncbi:hypothetical protein E3N88_23581 [Mikania micrantha]|uniref:ARM repeat superfamily protein n=1 Tax=Mikania micrantha TaxID=192012 RepID=A0A5N6NFB3_9ASTR|nr:hypothetical protein E3N88_23581 [Mikania micrantha]